MKYIILKNIPLLVFFLMSVNVNADQSCSYRRISGTITYPNFKAAADAACDGQVNYIIYKAANYGSAICYDYDEAGNYYPENSHETVSCSADEFYVDLNDLDRTDQSSGQSCPSTENPINILTGNKYKIHSDISRLGNDHFGFPEFLRTYNSISYNSDSDIGINWSHSYQQKMIVRDSYNSGVNLNKLAEELGEPAQITGKAGMQSSVYSGRQTACSEGFNELKIRLGKIDGFNSTLKLLLSGGAIWEYPGRCNVYVKDRFMLTIPVKGHLNGLGDNPPLWGDEIKIIRPDGNEIRFNRNYSANKLTQAWKNTVAGSVDTLIQVPSGELGLTEEDLAKKEYLFSKIKSTWEYLDKNNIKEVYNDEGRLIKIEYPDGQYKLLSYSENIVGDVVVYKLTKVENSMGKYIELTYNEGGFIKTLTTSDNRVWSYKYDNIGRLESVINPDLTYKKYHYENFVYPHLLTGVTDESGIRYSTFEYYADGWARLSYLGSPDSEMRISSARVEYYTYFRNRYSIVTDSRDNKTKIRTTDIGESGLTQPIVKAIYGPDCINCTIPDSLFNYDNLSEPDDSSINLVARSDYGINKSYLNYDQYRNPGEIREAVGTTDERSKSYTYNDLFKSKINTTVEASVFSSAEKITTYTYDEYSNIISTRVDGFTPGGVPLTRIIYYKYDGPFHQISEIDGPRTDVFDIYYFDYYANNASEGNNRARLKSVRSYSGQYFRNNIQYTATGKVLSEDRLSGLHIDYAYYTGNDRLQDITQTDIQSGMARTTHYSYLPTGEVKTVVEGYGSGEAVQLTLNYDNARRLTRVTDGLGSYIDYILDTEGNLIEQKVYDAAGTLKKALAQTFDSYNRLESSTQLNENRVIDFNPDGTIKSVTDGKGVVNEYDYDSLKRLVKYTQDKDGSNSQTANALTEFGYDVQDNLISVKAANDAKTTYVYDDLGNLLSRTSPDTGTVSYQHDAAGNIIQSIDAKGQTFVYQYDSNNRLLSIDAPGEEDDTYLAYDTCTQGERKLCQITRKNSTLKYRYNAFSDVVGIDQSLITWKGYNTANNTIGYDYDAVGRISSITYPSGTIINYTYNAAGKVDNVHMEQDGVITNLSLNIEYLPFGKESIQTYGNGLNIHGLYDQAYRPFIIGEPSFYFEYISAYDENGNIKNLMTLDDQSYVNSIFDYDEYQRLMSSSGFHGEFDYTYDKAGNKQTQVGNALNTIFTYAANSNRLTELNSAATNIDENGNTTSLRGMAFTFTADNRLKSTNTGIAFEYNGFGQRSIKHTIATGVAGSNGYSSSTSYIYGLNGELLAEIGPGGSVKKEYVYLNNQLLAMLDRTPSSNESILNADLDQDGEISVEDLLIWYFNNRSDTAYEVTGDGLAGSDDINAVINCGLTQGSCVASSFTTEIYYVHNDHLGTPKMLSNSSGQPVWHATATPFGKASVNNDVDGDGIVVEFNIRQPGQYYDRESGLYYNYYRYYDPETGRYITSDPIGLNGGINTYAYALNNPLRYTDPNGLCPVCPAIPYILGAGAAYGGYVFLDHAADVRKEQDTNNLLSDDYFGYRTDKIPDFQQNGIDNHNNIIDAHKNARDFKSSIDDLNRARSLKDAYEDLKNCEK